MLVGTDYLLCCVHYVQIHGCSLKVDYRLLKIRAIEFECNFSLTSFFLIFARCRIGDCFYDFNELCWLARFLLWEITEEVRAE